MFSANRSGVIPPSDSNSSANQANQASSIDSRCVPLDQALAPARVGDVDR